MAHLYSQLPSQVENSLSSASTDSISHSLKILEKRYKKFQKLEFVLYWILYYAESMRMAWCTGIVLVIISNILMVQSIWEDGMGYMQTQYPFTRKTWASMDSGIVGALLETELGWYWKLFSGPDLQCIHLRELKFSHKSGGYWMPYLFAVKNRSPFGKH